MSDSHTNRGSKPRPDSYKVVQTERAESGSAIWFIVGGLVVAIGIVAYVIFGGGVEMPAGEAGGDTNVSVEVDDGPAPVEGAAPEAAPESAAPATEAPADAPADAPAEPATGTSGN